MTEKDLKTVRVNNALYIIELSEHIQRFCKRAHVEGMFPGNLQTYFCQVAQLGHTWGAEFWVVLQDSIPCAFAEFEVSKLPHISKVYCLAIHGWAKDRRVRSQSTDLLVTRFIEFGEKNNAKWWSADFVGRANVRLFTKKMIARGFPVRESNIINCVFKRS